MCSTLTTFESNQLCVLVFRLVLKALKGKALANDSLDFLQNDEMRLKSPPWLCCGENVLTKKIYGVD